MNPCLQLSAARSKLEETRSLSESDVADSRRRAFELLEEESRTWAAAQKATLRQRALDQAMEEVRWCSSQQVLFATHTMPALDWLASLLAG